MADKKISQLSSATLPLAGTELVPVVQSGATVKVSAASLGAAAAYTPAGVGAVVSTVQAKLRESVSVKDFGAVGDGVTDDSAAVQLAITYCIANNLDLLVPTLCLLSSSVNIDRQVDGAAYDNYFTIHGGGGFVVSTAIPMFSSSIPYTTAPVTQLTRFKDIRFESSDSSLAAYVLHDGRFLRSVFDGCSFRKIKAVNAVTTITQSLYFINCNIRRFTGIFFNSSVYTYDLKVLNCLVEAGVDSFKISNPVGCSFVNSCIEGQSGTAISYSGAEGLNVSGCYFEANGLDVDGTYGGASASNSYGVCLAGNYFSHSFNSVYSVKWGAIFKGVSIGNRHNNNMHNFTSAIADVVVRDFATGTLCATVINEISAGFSGTFTGTFTGCTTAPTTTIYYDKTGNTVTLRFSTLTATSNATTFTITGMPTELRPARQQLCLNQVTDNSIRKSGSCLVDTTGVLFMDTLTGGFVASGLKGTYLSTITYIIN